MAFTYGFYNSVNHDRVYDATQFMNLFDGILRDGVFMTVGDHFAVKARSGMSLIVGSGRCWFNGTWSWNSTALVVTVPDSDLVYNRKDSVVLEINKNVSVRRNRIFVKKGTPGPNPEPPALVKSGNIYQYRIANVEVPMECMEINDTMIQFLGGTSEFPIATGLMDVWNVDAIWSQWEARFNEWFKKLQSMMEGDVAGNLLGMIVALTTRVEDLENLMPVTFTGNYIPTNTNPKGSKDNDFYYKFYTG